MIEDMHTGERTSPDVGIAAVVTLDIFTTTVTCYTCRKFDDDGGDPDFRGRDTTVPAFLTAAITSYLDGGRHAGSGREKPEDL